MSSHSRRRRRTVSEKQITTVAETPTGLALVPYDEHLLERARTQWQFGDWGSLIRIERSTLQHHPDRAKLALLVAAGHLQSGNQNEAMQSIRIAKDWGCSNTLILQILAAGVHNSLGRAAAISNQQGRALQHFENAIAIGTPSADVKLLTQARTDEQMQQLGFSSAQYLLKDVTEKTEAGLISKSGLADWIQAGLESAPDAAPLLIAAAESAQRSGALDTAIRYWQRLAAVDGSQMAQIYYERLGQAYKQLKSFPLANAEEEALHGDTDKYQVLKHIHQVLQPRNYLEIGVQTGLSLFLATCSAIGVDPMPMVSTSSYGQVQLVRSTSDRFFDEQAPDFIKEPIDMAFIDGMHLFEYALRDFINIEKYAGAHTLVVIDDILPGHPAQAERDRRTRAWTGDVWKLLPTLRQHRPDLSLLMLDAYPTGLLCVSGLNSSNSILQNSYRNIVAEMGIEVSVPDAILAREGAFPCDHPKLDALLTCLYETRRVNVN